MHVAVVGAGIIGLTAAVRLRAAGHAVTLIAPELDTAGRPHAVAGATPVSYTHLRAHET